MKKRLTGAPPIYSEQEKIAIAREYLTGDLGYALLGKKHGLSKVTIIHFVKWYRTHYPDLAVQTTVPVTLLPVKQADTAPGAQERAKDKELEQARLKIAALELLLANAKKDLGIDLLKKPGTKQSNK